MIFYSYQPAPFFVLDEIDAALDNTNIGKVRMPELFVDERKKYCRIPDTRNISSNS